MTSEALFTVHMSCQECGRPTHANGCQWCNHKTGISAKEAGMANVKNDPEWGHRCDLWLSGLPFGSVICADDLVREAGLPMGSSNQVGARFARWAKAGWISEHGMTKGTRPESHGRRLLTWEVVA